MCEKDTEQNSNHFSKGQITKVPMMQAMLL